MERVLIQPSSLWQLNGFMVEVWNWATSEVREQILSSTLDLVFFLQFIFGLNVWFQLNFFSCTDTVVISGCVAVVKVLRKVCMNR